MWLGLISAIVSLPMVGYAQSLRGLETKPLNSVDEAIARLSGADGRAPASANEIVNMLMGSDGSGGDVRVIQGLKQKLSPESWNALRQGVWQKLTTRGEDMIPLEAQALHTRLSRFLNDKGREAGQVLFTKEAFEQAAAPVSRAA
jgi:hypothetical protein